MPKFSIIIPAYNCGDKIKILANQILTQDYADFELIIVNDGSTDNTLEVIKSLNDARLVLVDQKNSGPSAARNAGIKKANGEFIIFCDADDQINQKNFTKMLNEVEKSDSDMLIFAWEIIQKDKNQKILSRRKLFQKQQTISGNSEIIRKTIKSIGDDGRMYNLWNKIYRTKIIKQNKLQLYNNLRFGEDLIFNFHFLKHCSKIFFSNIEPIYIYEEDSSTSIVSKTKLDFNFRLRNLEELDKFYQLIPPSDESNSRINFIKWRWLISYCLSICNSNLNIQQKIKSLNQAISNLKPAKISSQNLSQRQRLILPIAKIITKSSLLSLLFFSLINLAKKHRRARNISIELDLV